MGLWRVIPGRLDSLATTRPVGELIDNEFFYNSLLSNALPDQRVLYYQANGATSGGVQDAEREFLLAQGAGPAHNHDMWVELLRALGHTGALSDMRYEFRAGGGAIPENNSGYETAWGASYEATWGVTYLQEWV